MNPFLPGDKVVCIDPHDGNGMIPPVIKDQIYCVYEAFYVGNIPSVTLVGWPYRPMHKASGKPYCYHAKRFRLVNRIKTQSFIRDKIHET